MKPPRLYYYFKHVVFEGKILMMMLNTMMVEVMMKLNTMGVMMMTITLNTMMV